MMKGLGSIARRVMTIILSTIMVVSMIPTQAYAKTFDNEGGTYENLADGEGVEVNADTNNVTVTGDDINADVEDGALEVYVGNGKNTNITTGKISNTYEDGIHVHNGDYEVSGGRATLTINGDVTAYDDGVYADTDDGGTTSIAVNGSLDVDDDGVIAYTYNSGKSTIMVNGHIDAGYYGVHAESYSGGTNSITVNGSIDTDEDGVYAESYSGGTNSITVNGSIKAGYYGIGSWADDNGIVNIKVTGDVTSDYVGIYADAWGDNEDNLGSTSVWVDGTVTGNEIGVGIYNYDQQEYVRGNISVTAWRIIPNADNAVAGYYDDEQEKYVQDPVFEQKNISYIIKVEQPAAGATLTASHETAHEGDKVTLNINVGSGWTITGAYSGLGEKVELFRDENGNYFVIVPKGGGVYLSVTTFAPERPVTKFEESKEEGSSLCASIAQMITEAAQGATVRVTIPSGSSLCKMAVDALEARPDVTLVVDYAVKGGMYEATIPGGDSRPDLKQYKNAAGGIDFETLTIHFGGKQIF